jgi:hypothetical protein
VTLLHFYKNYILFGFNFLQQNEKMKAECYTYAHGIQIMIVFHIVNQIDPFDFFLILGAGMISLRKLGTIGWILMPAWTCTLSDPRREEEVQVHKQYLM